MHTLIYDFDIFQCVIVEFEMNCISIQLIREDVDYVPEKNTFANTFGSFFNIGI